MHVPLVGAPTVGEVHERLPAEVDVPRVEAHPVLVVPLVVRPHEAALGVHRDPIGQRLVLSGRDPITRADRNRRVLRRVPPRRERSLDRLRHSRVEHQRSVRDDPGVVRRCHEDPRVELARTDRDRCAAQSIEAVAGDEAGVIHGVGVRRAGGPARSPGAGQVLPFGPDRRFVEAVGIDISAVQDVQLPRRLLLGDVQLPAADGGELRIQIVVLPGVLGVPDVPEVPRQRVVPDAVRLVGVVRGRNGPQVQIREEHAPLVHAPGVVDEAPQGEGDHQGRELLFRVVVDRRHDLDVARAGLPLVLVVVVVVDQANLVVHLGRTVLRTSRHRRRALGLQDLMAPSSLDEVRVAGCGPDGPRRGVDVLVPGGIEVEGHPPEVIDRGVQPVLSLAVILDGHVEEVRVVVVGLTMRRHVVEVAHRVVELAPREELAVLVGAALPKPRPELPGGAVELDEASDDLQRDAEHPVLAHRDIDLGRARALHVDSHPEGVGLGVRVRAGSDDGRVLLQERGLDRRDLVPRIQGAWQSRRDNTPRSHQVVDAQVRSSTTREERQQEPISVQVQDLHVVAPLAAVLCRGIEVPRVIDAEGPGVGQVLAGLHHPQPIAARGQVYQVMIVRDPVPRRVRIQDHLDRRNAHVPDGRAPYGGVVGRLQL